MVRFHGHFRETLEPFSKNFVWDQQTFLCSLRNYGWKNFGIIFLSTSKKILLEFLSSKKHFILRVIKIHATFSSEYKSAPMPAIRCVWLARIWNSYTIAPRNCELRISTNCSLYTIREFVKFMICAREQPRTDQLIVNMPTWVEKLPE